MSFPFHKVEDLQSYRQKIYKSLDKSPDSIMELLDTIAISNQESPIRLSLEPTFSRRHSTISQVMTKVLDIEKLKETLSSMLEEIIKLENNKEFLYYSIDETSIFKQHAECLKGKGYVHGVTNGTSPIGIGHSYSYVVRQADKNMWTIPVDIERVELDQKGTLVGLKQFISQVGKYKDNIHVMVADSKYSNVQCLHEIFSYDNALMISRMNGVRNLYFPANGKSHKKYGDEFKLHDLSTWSEPCENKEFEVVTAKGKVLTVKLRRWNDLIVRGKREMKMHDKKLDIVKVEFYNAEGKSIQYKNMWLVAAGKEKASLDIQEIYYRYAKRYNIEHVFRFSKQKLLLSNYETPDIEVQDRWVLLNAIVYLNMFASSGIIASEEMNPWYKNKASKDGVLTPYQTKANYGLILDAVGTPAKKVEYKKRGSGREKGTVFKKRVKHAVTRKTEKKAKNTASEKQTKTSEPKSFEFSSNEEIISVLKLTEEQKILLENRA